ncbi:dihydropteroate synthase [Oleidesulfovibrio alaskensis G20]|jgi:dihydropteroate synthase|uniref:Dihydropteroate synthase n=1 Tax=Oleidesulfovibrio alaskensis (strain ATCC BAA-1058 / DSM 17464 / G20) TaxID=207559 RepID=Q311T3_OLEA2|nr:dihydropteroate synthase [Oleidesulfovibrio alaskensis]ABB38313.1 dihydropteroate synthase [Oleidesulfovibrio alaskensis G20]MBG0774210.1 dihydropteroate synthase [Oleidesulfovibrio alaskensis]
MLPPIHWEIAGGRAIGPAPFFIFGIVNVTPDSFYDGGRHDGPDSAVSHALQLAEQGAHVLDIGGESSRPYADPVSQEDEIRRVLPVVKALRDRTGGNGLPWALSVDTYKSGTAAAVLEAGAGIINDISACSFDPALKDVIAQYKPGYVLMHSPGRPETMQDKPAYGNVVEEILDFFEKKLKELVVAGVPEQRIILDPGIGFGKLLEHNLDILRHIDRFMSLGRPVMGALSNKSMFGQLLGLAADERQNATQAATALLAARGVRFHRVHEVRLAAQTLNLAAELYNA